MNKVILIGNLTRDPEISTTNSGVNVCKFTIAVKRPFAGQDGERETDFFNVVAWRGLGDNCGKFLKKGSKCAVIGSLQNRNYDAQDGTKRYVTEIIANEVEFLSQPSGNGQTTSKPNADLLELQPIEDPDSLPF